MQGWMGTVGKAWCFSETFTALVGIRVSEGMTCSHHAHGIPEVRLPVFEPVAVPHPLFFNQFISQRRTFYFFLCIIPTDIYQMPVSIARFNKADSHRAHIRERGRINGCFSGWSHLQGFSLYH